MTAFAGPRSLIAAALAAAIALAPVASAAEALKVSSYLPPNGVFQTTLEELGADLAARTGGALTFEIYPAGQLGPMNRQFDLVKTGVADIAIVLHSATPGRFPLSEIAGLPLSYPSSGQKSAITSRRLMELAPDYLAAEHPGMKILWMAVTPPLKMHLAKLSPTSIDDLKGLRIRYAGKVFQQIVEAVGAVPMPVPPSETADSLSKGIVDGAMFPFEAAKSFDLGTVVNYSVLPGVASATFAVVMNQARFDALPADQQAAIESLSGPALAQHFGELWDAEEALAQGHLEGQGVTVVTLPAAEVERLRTAVAPIVTKSIEAVEATGRPARAFFEAYTK